MSNFYNIFYKTFYIQNLNSGDKKVFFVLEIT